MEVNNSNAPRRHGEHVEIEVEWLRWGSCGVWRAPLIVAEGGVRRGLYEPHLRDLRERSGPSQHAMQATRPRRRPPPKAGGPGCPVPAPGARRHGH